MKNHKAFTLLEIMITVIVLGVMATLAVVGYRKMMTQARIDTAKHTLIATHSTALIYKAKKGSFYQSGGWLSLGSFNTAHETSFTVPAQVTFFYQSASVAMGGFNIGYIWDEGTPEELRIEVNGEEIDASNPCCKSAACSGYLPNCPW